MPFVVALLTPFDSGGRVDLAKLRAHVLWLAAQGAEGFLSTGYAGEFLYLSDREREAIHRTVIESAMGKQVFPCTWDPSPATANYLSEAALKNGATAVVLPPPLLYDLDDHALLKWYESAATAGRVLAYHHDQACPGILTPARVEQLFAKGLIGGLIDHSGDPWRVQRLAAAHPNQIWSADDSILPEARKIPSLAGVVSDVANVWPSFTRRVWEGEQELVSALRERQVRVRRAGGLRALKSLKRMGCRPPLVEPPDELLQGIPSPEAPSRGAAARSFPPS